MMPVGTYERPLIILLTHEEKIKLSATITNKSCSWDSRLGYDIWKLCNGQSLLYTSIRPMYIIIEVLL